MSNILEIAELLQDTDAALSSLTRATAQGNAPKSLSLIRRSLLKRQSQLEKQFEQEAARTELDVCSYRIFSERESRPALLSLANALKDFQTWFTVVYDAMKEGPKQRARISPEILAETAFDFGYTFAGSVGFMLTMPNERLLIGSTLLDDAMAAVLEMAKSESSDQIASFSKRYGSSAIKQMYNWTTDHISGGIGADIEWRRDQNVRANLFAQLPHLINLQKAILETSDEVYETIRLRGMLVGIDTNRHTFHMTFPDAEDIRGSASEAVGTTAKTVELPKPYTAVLEKTTKINYATEEEKVTYHLVDLLPPSA